VTLPTTWAVKRITAHYLLRDGRVPTGTVTFSSPQIVLVDGTIVMPVDIVVPLDVNGYIDVLIPATNDPDVSPAGWAYTVQERIDGCAGRRFAMAVDANGGDIDLAIVAPMVAPPAMGAFPFLLKGAAGIAVVDALPVTPDPDTLYITTT